MRSRTLTLTLSLTLAPLGAQEVGSEAPEMQFAKTFGFDGMTQTSLSQLRGSVVLLEFWGTT